MKVNYAIVASNWTFFGGINTSKPNILKNPALRDRLCYRHKRHLKQYFKGTKPVHTFFALVFCYATA